MKNYQIPKVKSKFWLYFSLFLAAKVFLISFALQKSEEYLNIPSEKDVLEKSGTQTPVNFEANYNYAVGGKK